MNPLLMKYLFPKKSFKYQFDFEVGYLTKSPCRDCMKKEDFPRCIDGCSTLDEIHTILSEAVSCSKRS